MEELVKDFSVKGEKEDKSRTEILHQKQCTDTSDAEYEVFCEAPRGEQFFERYRSDEYEWNLDKLRGLDWEESEVNPVESTVDTLGKDKVCGKYQYASDCRRVAEHTRNVDVFCEKNYRKVKVGIFI